MIEIETVPCKTCGTPTQYLGTKLCDNCFEVERRLEDYLKSQKGQEFVDGLLGKKPAQERLIALLDELGIENWVGGMPRKWGEPDKGWWVLIPQDDIENSSYYRYIKFEFTPEGEFVDFDIDGEWKEPEESV